MLRIASTLTLGLLVLTGCPGDDTGTTAGSAGSTTAEDPTAGTTVTDPTAGTTVAATESADTTAGQTTDTPMTTDVPGTTTDEPGTTTDTPGTTTDEPGTTTGGNADVCAPDPADDACATCVKTECCPDLEACQLDAGCACFQECAQMNPGVAGAIQCGADCGVNPLAPMTPTGNLAGCTQEFCGKCLG